MIIAPTGQDEIAQGNALGYQSEIGQSPERAKWEVLPQWYTLPLRARSVQSFNCSIYSGRCPGLSHEAPSDGSFFAELTLAVEELR